MDLTRFRGWAGHTLVDYETRTTYTGNPNPYTAAAENLEEITEEKLVSREYRRKHRLMLPSGVSDIHGTEIYEGDVVEIFSWRAVRFTMSRMAFVECLPEQGFVVEGAHVDPLKQGLDCQVIGNFYANPEWLDKFDARGALAKRWE